MATQSATSPVLEASVTESNVISTAFSHVNSRKLAEVEFCPRADADVKLVITSTDGDAHFLVNSQVLCIPSPVFKAMLGSNSKFREATSLAERGPSAEPLEVQLGDDNPNALAVILWVIHYRCDMVSPTFTQDRLYEIAIIVDKYDLARSVTFPTKQWVQQLNPLSNAQPLDCVWLFIAFAIQAPDIFERASKEAIVNTAFIAEKAQLSPSYQRVPQRILTHISNIRSEIVNLIYSEAKSILDTYSEFTGSECKRQGDCSSIGRTCDALMFGLCSSTFLKGGILDSKFPRHCSLIYLSNVVQNMQEFPNFVLADGNFDCCRLPREVLGSPNCFNCMQRYAQTGRGPGHAVMCSPLPEFKKKVSILMSNINGLKLKDFIRPVERKAPANKSFEEPVDLWENLVYVDAAV